jgi:hypothetical protein
MRRLVFWLGILAPALLSVALPAPAAGAREVTPEYVSPAPSPSVLSNNLLVTWYGNPNDSRMGVLGQFSGDDLAQRLSKQASAYSDLTNKNVMAAYELIAVVAQGSAGADGMWRRREDGDMIDSMLQQARSHGFKLVLDVQPGQSTVQEEIAFLRPWLEQPDVYLALDPEFDMWTGQTPGVEIGHMNSDEVNFAINYLDRLVNENGLPPKVLIVHQFTLHMLPDKENIIRSPVVDLVLDMDGFGAQWLKLDSYNMVMDQGRLDFAGIKLFYDQDPDMFAPAATMKLGPLPSVVIYQ